MTADGGALYAIDTSSLSALEESYPRDLFEHAWTVLESLDEQSRLLSVEDVLIELSQGPTSVLAWARNREHLFVPLDHEIQSKAREVLVAYPRLVDMKRPHSSADPFLIGRALITGATVVTEEARRGGTSRIPDACAGMGLPYISLLQFLKVEGRS